MSETEAVAKAVEKTADAAKQAIQSTEKVGRFFSKVFKGDIAISCG